MPDIITVDYETYWSSQVNLSKLTPIEYIDHPEFEVVSCAIKHNDGPSEVYFGEAEISDVLEGIDWSKAALLAHNGAEFDHLISAQRFFVKPKLWLDTLQMARPLHGMTVGGSLKALARHYGLGAKGDLEAGTLAQTKGKHLADFTQAELDAMAEYNKQDTDLCYALAQRLMPKTSREELKIMDITTRMWTQPQFRADLSGLRIGLKAERERKQRAVQTLATRLGHQGLCDDQGTVIQTAEEGLRKTLGSPAKFRELIEGLGARCPMKWSEKQEKDIPAVAKSDAGMTALLEHPNEYVAAAAALRLDVSSTILETRLERMIHAARAYNGMMPIPLRYGGALVTNRWSGTAKLNYQNLTRVDPKHPKPTDVLRKSLIAPKGYAVVVADLSGIELRVNHHLWQVPSSVAAFKQDRDADLYKLFASESLYHVPFDEVTKDQRRNAKIAQLQLGYQSGWEKFQDTARQYGVNFTDAEAQRIVEVWRQAYKEIVQGWRTCHTLLPVLANPSHDDIGTAIDPWGLCTIEYQAIRTPKGMLRYPDLRMETTYPRGRGETQWVYAGKGKTKKRKTYGGNLVENLSQHLSRYVLTDVILAFAKTGLGKRYPLAHTVHDEVVYVVRQEDAQAVLDTLLELMKTPPTWWPELVTWAEGDIADTYGDAK